MYRHEPLTAQVMSLINDGAIGTVRAVVSGFTFALEAAHNIRLDPALGGGSLWDVGGYPVTYAQLITGHEPKMVFGTAHWHAVGRRRRVHGHAAIRRRHDRQHLCRVSAPRIARGSRSSAATAA